MKKGFTAIEAILGVIGLVILPLFAYGWVVNIIKLANAEFCLCSMPILRIIGIFVAPLGAVLGFF